MSDISRARVWCVGDDINTDLIVPIEILPIAREERPQHVFRANRPGWAAQVRKGDILIGGKNFGMGSSRPAAMTMKDLGLACVLAESVNGLFFRNCVNFALPMLAIEGIHAAFLEGDEAEVDFGRATVTNLRTGVRLSGKPWPELMLQSMRAGGLVELLEAEGRLHPLGWSPPA